MLKIRRYNMKLFKFDIRTKTLINKGIKPIHDDFFIALITGYQGSGKNYLATMLVNELKDRTIITNVKSLKIPNRKILYFTKLQEIYQWKDEKCVFLIGKFLEV